MTYSQSLNVFLLLQKTIGILSRENGIFSLPISAGIGSILQILVENQGRINFNIADDLKGVIGNISLNDKPIFKWNTTGFPLDDSSKFNYLNGCEDCEYKEKSNAERLSSGPVIFRGSFNLNAIDIHDTYINPAKWGKVTKNELCTHTIGLKFQQVVSLTFLQGSIFINGFNLGRYWPLGGPQITLYLPKELLQEGQNSLILVELQRAPESGLIDFSDSAILNG